MLLPATIVVAHVIILLPVGICRRLCKIVSEFLLARPQFVQVRPRLVSLLFGIEQCFFLIGQRRPGPRNGGLHLGHSRAKDLVSTARP